MSDGSTPRFLQGVFEFEGNGLDKPALLDDSLRYVVPAGAVTQPVYFRGGNSTDEIVTVVLFRNGAHALLPDRRAGSDPRRAAGGGGTAGRHRARVVRRRPDGCSGTAVVDLGLVEL